MDAVLDFNRIVKEHEGRIVRYLTGLLGDAALAQDPAQEAFLRVHTGLAQLRSPKAHTAWIYRIASNLALDHLRSRTSRQEGRTVSLEAELPGVERVEPAIPSEELSADGRLEQEDVAACIRRYIHQLPGAYRACLILRDLEGLGRRPWPRFWAAR